MKERTYAVLTVASILSLLVSVLFGCGGSSDSGGSGPGIGTLRVSLTDAPAAGFDAINVTIEKVRVHQSAGASPEAGAGWTDITLNPPRKINLLDLQNGVLETLGETTLSAGHYTQLRLVLSANTGTTIANSVVLSGTTEELPLVTPSAVQSGIKLVNEFDVLAGQRVDLVLDFDALKSIVKRGNGTYALKPVIKVVPMVLTGIDGFIATSLTSSGDVLVSAQQNGVEVRSTSPDPQTGEFFLSHLAAGSYDVVISSGGHATAVIAGVPVSASTATALATTVSTSAEPISLPTSTMQSVSGAVTLNPPNADATAILASRQTVTAGLAVTVKSLQVDGDYSLSLPSGAPLFGQYGALPIALSEQAGAAGKYTLEVSATGYLTQSSDIDIATAGTTTSFTLTP